MMNKRLGLFVALTLWATIAIFTACSAHADNPSMFVCVEQSSIYKVVYHKDTKVMYAISDGSYNHGTFTLLVNADGTPMTYND